MASAFAAALAFNGRPPTRRAAVGVALAVLLHLALIWMATRPLHIPAARDDWVGAPVLQLLRPMLLVRPAPPAPPVPHPSSPQASLPSRHLPAPGVAVEAAPAQPKSVPQPATTPAPDSPEERALLAPPQPPPAVPLSGDILQQALKSAGAIDRQLRAEHPQEFTAPPDTPRSRLIRGLAAAHAAVGPKWFEEARIELFTAPNDPRRIYRVTTAAGEYCLFYPDKASMSTNMDAKSGWAGFGQPTMAKCPIEF